MKGSLFQSHSAPRHMKVSALCCVHLREICDDCVIHLCSCYCYEFRMEKVNVRGANDKS